MKLLLPLKTATVYGYTRPIKSVEDFKYIIAKQGQFFGQDLSGPACNWDATKSCDITFYQSLGLSGHNGLDIPVITGEGVYASTDGTVRYAGGDQTSGIGVEINDLVQGCRTIYWHLKEVKVGVGEKVKAGQLIGLSDNTGYSTGPHLHYGMKRIDLNGNPVNYNNGYWGAEDPIPYLVYMDKKQKLVQKLQALEGFSDQSGVDYWSKIFGDDGLSEASIDTIFKYLDARIPDKINELEKAK